MFIGFAPVKNPRIALAVVVENGGSGSKVAAPIARKVFDKYFEEYGISDADKVKKASIQSEDCCSEV